MEKVKETIQAKYTFTQEEKNDNATRMANSYHNRTAVAEEFSAIKKQWTGKIDAINNEIENYARKISTGYEFRATECEVRFDANKRRKYYFRLTDGAPVHDEEMSASDFQLQFPDNPSPEQTGIPPLNPIADAFEKAEGESASQAAEPPSEPEPPAKKKGVKSRKKKEQEPAPEVESIEFNPEIKSDGTPVDPFA